MQSQMGERMGVQTKYKFGQGIPQYGMPGIAYEVRNKIFFIKNFYFLKKYLTWMGNGLIMRKDSPPSPNLQLQVGPFSYRDLLNERFKTALGGHLL